MMAGDPIDFREPLPVTRADVLQSGMSLRDYFAGQALTGLLAGGFADTVPHDDIQGGSDAAAFAYQYADAMIAARSVKETQE